MLRKNIKEKLDHYQIVVPGQRVLSAGHLQAQHNIQSPLIHPDQLEMATERAKCPYSQQLPQLHLGGDHQASRRTPTDVALIEFVFPAAHFLSSLPATCLPSGKPGRETEVGEIRTVVY